MELLQLYYFQVTARCEHISAAARQLHIAQPALSQTIRRLENELGTPLFDRTGRHIRLNRYGKIFLKYTDTVLNALTDARAEISEALCASRQQVTLCVLAASSLLPDILEQFTLQYPKYPLSDHPIRLGYGSDAGNRPDHPRCSQSADKSACRAVRLHPFGRTHGHCPSFRPSSGRLQVSGLKRSGRSALCQPS